MVRTGRPKKPKADRRAIVICARLTRAEYERLREAAKRAGIALSSHVRNLLTGKKATP